MCETIFKNLRLAVDEKHREAHRRIGELEAYLSGSAGAGTASVHPKPARNGGTARESVDRACAAWANVEKIASESGLSAEQVRGVLYDPFYKKRYEKRKSKKGSPVEFRFKEE